MSMLPRYTLKSNKFKGGWALLNQEGETIATFPTKVAATAQGSLER